MNQFTFTNKAYDLLLSLKEEGIIVQKTYKPSGLKELRLAIDMIKDTYPLYATADNRTMLDFVEDIFCIRPTETELTKASHMEEEYRPVQINEINPGIQLKIVDTSGTYFHTFWTYADTKKIIPTKERSLQDYDRAWRYIWEKAKQEKVFIKNTYQYKIGDTISYYKHPEYTGVITHREMRYDFKNIYSVEWTKGKPQLVLPFKEYYIESELISKKRLEAMPMKTINITKEGRGKPRIKTYKQWTPEQYAADKVEYKYTTDEEAGKAHAGWIEYIITYPGSNRKPSIDRNKQNRRQSRKNKHIKNLQVYKPKSEVEIIDRLVCVKDIHTGIVDRIRHNKAEKLVSKPDSNYIYTPKTEWQKYLNAIKKKYKEANPPKYFKLGTEIIQDHNGEAKEIDLDRKGRRSYKHKIRKGSFLVKEQFVTKIVPEVKEDLRVKDGTWEGVWANQILKVVRPAHTVIKRILTRVQPHKEIKITEEVLNQRAERSTIDKTNHAAIRGLMPLIDLKEEFAGDERRNHKYSLVEKWSKTFDELQMLIFHNKLYENETFKANINPKALKDVIKLKVNWAEDKIERFIRYMRLTTHGVFTTVKDKVSRPTGKRPNRIGKTGKLIEGKLYKKPSKVKKPIKPVEFETLRTVTKLDYSKLKINPPKENILTYIKFKDGNEEIEKIAIYRDNAMYSVPGDLMCQLRDVICWKYERDDEYQDLILDEGGGKTEVGVKFRRKDPEHLKKYITRIKKHKEYKKIYKVKDDLAPKYTPKWNLKK